MCGKDAAITLTFSATATLKHLRPSAGLRECCFAFPLYGGGNQGTEMLSDRTCRGKILLPAM